MIAMADVGRPVDPVTVSWEAARRDVVAGAADLAGGDGPFAVASAREVCRRGVLAQIAQLAGEIEASTARPASAPAAFLERAAERLARGWTAALFVTGGTTAGRASAAHPQAGVRVQCGRGITPSFFNATLPASGGSAVGIRSARAGGAGRRGAARVSGRGSSHRDYVRRRSRQIAYGRWQPWAQSAEPVRANIHQLRQGGASYRALARAGGVSPMTVHRLHRGLAVGADGAAGRVHAVHARRLLTITPDSLGGGGARRDGTGTRRRLRALIAMGHPAVSLAGRLEVPPRVVWSIVRGTTATVTPAMHAASATFTTRSGTGGRPSGPGPNAGPLPPPAPVPPGTAGRRRWAWTTTVSMIPATTP
jgi:hypothetical protein